MVSHAPLVNPNQGTGDSSPPLASLMG